MSQSKLFTPSRRRFISSAAGLSALAVAAPLVITSRKAFGAGKLVLVSWGGSYRTAVENALVKPFSQEMGVDVTVIDTPDLAKVKAQQMTGNIEWDVFDAPGALGTAGSKAGFWEPLDPQMAANSDLIVPMKKDLAPLYFFTGGIGWDPARYPEGKHPRNFAEYFDLKKFPGKRTFRNRPSETLEAALLADGVPPNKLYPLDVDRAFKALDRVKPSVVKWVEQTPQSITLLQSKEADFSYVYASRVKTQTDGKYGFSFDQTLNGLEYFAVLKNAPNKANAMAFVAYSLRPDRQAAFMEILGNLPASRKAMPMLKEETRKWMPNMSSPNNAILDDDWWANEFDTVSRRFKEWSLT